MAASSCIVVTGANKGIGRALVERLLADRPDTLIFLGSRDVDRGLETRRAILALDPAAAGSASETASADSAATSGWASRLQVLHIDVCDESSIASAVAAVAAHGVPLRALVNNAGIWGTARDTYTTNVLGAARVTDAFLPALRIFAAAGAKGGAGGGDGATGDARVVNVSSGVSPMFVSRCGPARKAWFASKAVPTRAEVAAAAAAYFDGLEKYELAQARAKAAGSDDAAAAAAAAEAAAASAVLVAEGYPAPDAQSAYFASKAFFTADTRALAAEFEAEGIAPTASSAGSAGSGAAGSSAGAGAGSLRAVACSPGMIATDMTTPFFAASGKSAEEAGALPPAAATRVLMHLLFAPDAHNGWFYGSDAKRSPLDAYRSPGSPEHEGEV